MKVTYRGLQKELRKRNISTKGSKAELSDRLQKAIATCGTSIVPGVLAPDAAAIERCGTGAKGDVLPSIAFHGRIADVSAAAVAVSTSPVVSAPLTVPVSVLTHQGA